MRQLVAMGELLVDFLPETKGYSLDHVKTFIKIAGGAPANVAVAYKKLGGNAYFMGQVGHDSFGKFLIDTLHQEGVNTDYIYQTHQANTSLVFISLDQRGERDFLFYRDPSADQLFEPKQVEKSIFEHAIFHFCSLGLAEYPLKHAHLEAIKYAKKMDTIISFDPNLRFSLWKNHEELRKTVLSFIPHAHILKLSIDELTFLAETTNIEVAVKKLFTGSVHMIILTKGEEGASLYLPHETYHIKAYSTEVVDTTGAGDAFIGAFLYQYALHEHHTKNYEEMLKFAAASSAIVVSKTGVIPSLPTMYEVNDFIKKT
ncbi:MAG: carbohydrate kinase [Bacillota bacterium]|nr:MAG: carbohydrate kinase [Bacillota bacterium]